MLTITIPSAEYFDEDKSEFVRVEEVTVELEHSLISLSKWESKFEKPFLSEVAKTEEETLAYIAAMNRTPNIAPEVFQRLDQKTLDSINAYIESKQTATWFAEGKHAAPSKEVITSELIYYWMVTANIPFECAEWHLNRLFTLIRVFSVKQEQPKKMGASELAAQRRALNEQRKKQYGTSG